MLTQRLSRHHHHHGRRSGSRKARCLRHRYWSPIILGAILLTPGIFLISTSPIISYIRTTCFALIGTGICFIVAGIIWATLEASRFRKRRQANARLQRFRDRMNGVSSSPNPQSPTGGISFINMPPMPPSYFDVIANDEAPSTSPPTMTSSINTLTSSETMHTSVTVLPVLENQSIQCQEVEDIVITSEPPPPYAEAILEQEPLPERRYSV